VEREGGPAVLLGVVADLVSQFGLTSLQLTVQACEALAGDEAPLDVAVLGQFKSGKSSLLNAVLGEPVFPVGALQVRIQHPQQRNIDTEVIHDAFLDFLGQVVGRNLRCARVIRKGGASTQLMESEELKGEDVLSGFACRLDLIFPAKAT
jgi:hypothetical protein